MNDTAFPDLFSPSMQTADSTGVQSELPRVIPLAYDYRVTYVTEGFRLITNHGKLCGLKQYKHERTAHREFGT